MEFLLCFVGFLVLLFVYGYIHEIGERILAWCFHILLRLGFTVWDTGKAQLKAHRERTGDKQAMMQNPKQMLVRASSAEPTHELLRPVNTGHIGASGELLRPISTKNV